MEPQLISMWGRVNHSVLEGAIDAVRGGRFPGWTVVHEGIGVEMVRGQGRGLGDWLIPANVSNALTPSMSEMPERVWVIVLEESGSRRREVTKFVFVGGDAECPVWARIRADASRPA